MTETDLRNRSQIERHRQKSLLRRIFCCTSTSCRESGGKKIHETLESATRRSGKRDVEVVAAGCMGLCSRGPLVRVEHRSESPRLYAEMTEPLARDLVHGKRRPSASLESHLVPEDLPFFARQTRIVLHNIGEIDPLNLDHFLARGGYSSLARALREMTPQEICDAIRQSGLRGRGGAGYPSGVKWDLVRKAADSEKYVVANGDEGDPGAFMDRTIMEDDPHRVLEGMLIAAYAVGATMGFIYVRGENPVAVERLRAAIDAAEDAGLIGHDILDSKFGCRIDVRIGAGAYVCGEETALIASIEGGRGTPRIRPPFPPEQGVFHKPTLINNVETFANIPSILQMGPEAFAEIGTPLSKGTKVFSMTGAVQNSGLIEVAMGTPLREIVYDIGGGSRTGRPIKAVQTGGPSGGCIPSALFDVPVDYQSMHEAGSMMGSGGMIVLDDSTCMVGLARFFSEFCREESCGKCVPCRVGTVQMSLLLRRIEQEEATLDDLELLEQLCDMVKNTSLCGLGQAAPNPVLSTLRHFRDEYTRKIGTRRIPGSRGDLSHMILRSPPSGVGP